MILLPSNLGVKRGVDDRVLNSDNVNIYLNSDVSCLKERLCIFMLNNK